MPVRVLLQPCFYLPEAWNGIDEHLLHLARHIDRREFEMIVGVGELDGPQSAELARRACLPTAPLPSGRAPALARVRALRRLYRSLDVDIVHIHTPAAGGQAPAALAARLAGAAPVLTIHQYQPWDTPRMARLINRTAQRFLFSRVVAVSRDVAASAVERCGLAHPLTVIGNGVDGPPSPPPPPNRGGVVVLGYFGRLSREKGVDILIEGLALARAAGCPFRALIVGDGPERPALEALAAARGLADTVEFRGFVPGARELMADVDIVAHTPRYEGFGLVILEAMAAARPVIVAPAPGGLAEMVVSGETGIVASDRSPGEIARVVRQLVANLSERERMGRAAYHRWRQHFSAVDMAAQTAALYREVLRLPPSDSTAPGPSPSEVDDIAHTPGPQPVNAACLGSDAGATAPRQAP